MWMNQSTNLKMIIVLKQYRLLNNCLYLSGLSLVVGMEMVRLITNYKEGFFHWKWFLLYLYSDGVMYQWEVLYFVRSCSIDCDERGGEEGRRCLLSTEMVTGEACWPPLHGACRCQSGGVSWLHCRQWSCSSSCYPGDLRWSQVISGSHLLSIFFSHQSESVTVRSQYLSLIWSDHLVLNKEIFSFSSQHILTTNVVTTN